MLQPAYTYIYSTINKKGKRKIIEIINNYDFFPVFPCFFKDAEHICSKRGRDR